MIYIYIYIYMYVCMYVCMYIYIYMYLITYEHALARQMGNAQRLPLSHLQVT